MSQSSEASKDRIITTFMGTMFASCFMSVGITNRLRIGIQGRGMLNYTWCEMKLDSVVHHISSSHQQPDYAAVICLLHDWLRLSQENEPPINVTAELHHLMYVPFYKCLHQLCSDYGASGSVLFYMEMKFSGVPHIYTQNNSANVDLILIVYRGNGYT